MLVTLEIHIFAVTTQVQPSETEAYEILEGWFLIPIFKTTLSCTFSHLLLTSQHETLQGYKAQSLDIIKAMFELKETRPQ